MLRRRIAAVLVIALSAITSGAWRLNARAAAVPNLDRQAWITTGSLGIVDPQPDNIYVSTVAAQEQARVLLHLDVPSDSVTEDQLAASEITLVEASDSVQSTSAALSACMLDEPFTGQGQLSGTPPATDCTARAPLTRETDGTWSLSLAVFAHLLLMPEAPGIAVFADDPAPPATYTVSFATSLDRVDIAPASPPEPAPDEVASPTSEIVSGNQPPSSPPTQSPVLGASPAGGAPNAPPPIARAGRALLRRSGSASSPTAVLLLVPMLAVAGFSSAASRRRTPRIRAVAAAVPVGQVAAVCGWAAVTGLAMLLRETAVYKIGLIAVVFIGAIGLHILVNWAGELSLSHAAFIGLPAFATAQVSTHLGVSPILAVPAGVAAGALLGLAIAVPALRARGLQVALVTLAAAVATEQFFFRRSWITGPSGGLRIPAPSLFGLELRTSRATLLVLAAMVFIAVIAARSLLDSKVGRALSLVRANPDAAAAAGIPVHLYRGAAFALAGAFAGFGGAAYVVWVQRVSARGFPLELGFTYLVIAVLAGRGGLAGLALSAVLLEGGAVFSFIPQDIALYLGPIALIYNVTRYQEGFNGMLREASKRFLERRERDTMTTHPRQEAGGRLGVRLPVVLASVILTAGFGALVLAWYHAGNTDQLWIQNQEIVSGGLGGLGLVVLGSMLLVRDALLHGRALSRASSDAAIEGDVDRAA